MQTWVALLRGINVGGNNLLPMQNLRVLLEDIGLRNARTYIQSGNCVFESDETDPEALSQQISDRIGLTFEFRPRVMVLTAQQLKRAVEKNPYPEAAMTPEFIHLYFLSQPAVDADLRVIQELKTPTEHITISKTVAYLYTPDGIGRSKLASQLERHLKVDVTARNLRSASKIAELAS